MSIVDFEQVCICLEITDFHIVSSPFHAIITIYFNEEALQVPLYSAKVESFTAIAKGF